MAITLDTTITVPEDIIFRELDGEAVLLNLETGIYFGLDDVGTRIWQLLDEHLSLRIVLECLQTEFDAGPEVLASDLIELADTLSSKGLIRIA